MKKGGKIFIKIILWSWVISVILIGCVAAPSICSLVALLLAAILVPIDKWQSFIRKYVKRGVQVGVAIGLLVVMCATMPPEMTADNTKQEEYRSVVKEKEKDPETETEKDLAEEKHTAEESHPAEENAQTKNNSQTEKNNQQTEEKANPAAPSHEHNYKEATCTKPKTCTVCGATEGSAKGHQWRAGNCTTPKTCTVCGATEGTVVHQWKAATCTEPKTCTVCGATEGSAAGHQWNAATYSAPKTCKSCGATEGSALEIPYKENYHNHVYTGGSSSTKYHYEADCPGKYSHEITWEEVERRGLGPCGTCVMK